MRNATGVSDSTIRRIQSQVWVLERFTNGGPFVLSRSTQSVLAVRTKRVEHRVVIGSWTDVGLHCGNVCPLCCQRAMNSVMSARFLALILAQAAAICSGDGSAIIPPVV